MHNTIPFLLDGCIATISPGAYYTTAVPQAMEGLKAFYKDTLNEQSAVLNTSKLLENIPSRGTRDG